MADSYTRVLQTIGEVLSVSDRIGSFTPETALLGSIPEFDSMAVVSLITALEERFGISIDDDEISAELFETVGTLHAFVDAKLA